MARKERMITRTINKTSCIMVVFDVNTNQPTERETTVAGTFKTDEDLTAKLKDLYETETEKVVHVKDVNVISELYGMTEQTFLDNAEIIHKKGDSEDEPEAVSDEEPEEGFLDD